MELDIAKAGGKSAGTLKVSDIIFACAYNEALIHQVIVAYLATGRQGSRQQKNRAAVAGGGKKPWRQKGTGNARAGTRSSPIWRKGGVTFAAEPQDHAQKVNKKMYSAALRSILSELVRQQRLMIIETLAIDQPKTRLLLGELAAFELQSALIVTEEVTREIYLAARNLHAVEVVSVNGIDPVSLVNCKMLVVTVAAVKQLESWLSK